MSVHDAEMTGQRLAPHPQHDAMLDVEQNLLLFSVVSDKGMQGVAVGHPPNQAWVGGQRDHGVALDAGEGSTNRFLTYRRGPVCGHCLNCFEQLSVCLCVCVPEVLAQGCGVIGEQRVNQAEQLHDSLVLPQVLVALQQEHELVAVTTCRGRHKTQHSFKFHSTTTPNPGERGGFHISNWK